MVIKLIVERKVIPGSQDEIVDFLRELRSAAVLQSGFVSGETLIDAYNPTIFITISTWNSISSWENWENNQERQAIIENINSLLQDKPLVRVWRDTSDAPPAAI